MTAAVLALNAGSSSLKFALYEAAERLPLLAAGKAQDLASEPRLTVRDASGRIVLDRCWPPGRRLSHEDLLPELFHWIDSFLGGGRLLAVGHRIVHGGERYADPVLVDEQVLADLGSLNALAPLHQPHNLAVLEAARAHRPETPQVGCFDTAFHRTLPPSAQAFALPAEWRDRGMRRYGFHGLSYEYLAGRLEARDPAAYRGRAILAHLGSGASLCALQGGESIETTMGFTAADGLVMSTRSGTLDPGLAPYLMRAHGLSAADVEDLIYNRSGLLGLSGFTGDMRRLLASEDASAKAAIDVCLHRLVRETGGLVALLGGLDALVFAGGVGENASAIRAALCERLAWLGVELDPNANAAHAPVISTAASPVRVHVIPTDEEVVIACHAFDLVGEHDRLAVPG